MLAGTAKRYSARSRAGGVNNFAVERWDEKNGPQGGGRWRDREVVEGIWGAIEEGHETPWLGFQVEFMSLLSSFPVILFSIPSIFQVEYDGQWHSGRSSRRCGCLLFLLMFLYL